MNMNMKMKMNMKMNMKNMMMTYHLRPWEVQSSWREWYTTH